jgi:hypothetical protein
MISQSAMLHSNSQRLFQTPLPQVENITYYPEGSFNHSPQSGTNYSAHLGTLVVASENWHPGTTNESLSDKPDSPLQSNLFATQQNNNYPPFTHTQGVTTSHLPTSTPISSGGQPYESIAFGHDAGFKDPELQLENFQHPMSINVIDQEHFGFYQQQPQNPSNAACSTNFPTFQGRQVMY